MFEPLKVRATCAINMRTTNVVYDVDDIVCGKNIVFIILSGFLRHGIRCRFKITVFHFLI